MPENQQESYKNYHKLHVVQGTRRKADGVHRNGMGTYIFLGVLPADLWLSGQNRMETNFELSNSIIMKKWSFGM
jgi:hypothetical protein